MGRSKVTDPEIQPSMHSGVNTRNTCPFNPHANCSQLQDAQQYEHAPKFMLHTSGPVECLEYLALSFNTWVTRNDKVHRAHQDEGQMGQRRQKPTSEVLQAWQAR